MPTQKYALGRDKPKRLEISWPSSASFDNLTVRLDGQIVTTVSHQSELLTSRAITLPDGSILTIQLPSDPYLKGTRALFLLHNDVPVPGSAADPTTNLRGRSSLLLLMGSLSLGAGLLTFGLTLVAQTAAFVPTAAAIMISAGLGLLVIGSFIRRNSRPALMLAAALFAIGGLAVVLAAPQYFILAALMWYLAYYFGTGTRWLKT